MIAQVERYVALDAPETHAVFVWYISTAPARVLQLYMRTAFVPKALGQASLDIAITRSFMAGLGGRIGLHADPKGGTELMEWYKGRKMTNFPAGLKLPRSIRVNDGRFFFYTPHGAYNASVELDYYRDTP